MSFLGRGQMFEGVLVRPPMKDEYLFSFPHMKRAAKQLSH